MTLDELLRQLDVDLDDWQRRLLDWLLSDDSRPDTRGTALRRPRRPGA